MYLLRFQSNNSKYKQITRNAAGDQQRQYVPLREISIVEVAVLSHEKS